MVTFADRWIDKSMFAFLFSRMKREFKRLNIFGSCKAYSDTSYTLILPRANVTSTGKEVDYCVSSAVSGELVASLTA